MKILVDADACPAVVKDAVVVMAEEFNISVMMVASVSHSTDRFVHQLVIPVRVDNLPQATDIAVINNTARGDIVVTQDYGLASLVLGKGGHALSPRGKVFTHKNITGLLEQRHLGNKIRRAGGRLKGPKAFTEGELDKFKRELKKLLTNIKEEKQE